MFETVDGQISTTILIIYFRNKSGKIIKVIESEQLMDIATPRRLEGKLIFCKV